MTCCPPLPHLSIALTSGSLCDKSLRGGVEQASGEAKGAGGRSEGTDRCGETIIEGVCEREEEDKKEKDPQHVGRKNHEALWMIQCCADGRETHVVTEGVTQNRTHQVTWNTNEEESFSQTSPSNICSWGWGWGPGPGPSHMKDACTQKKIYFFMHGLEVWSTQRSIFYVRSVTQLTARQVHVELFWMQHQTDKVKILSHLWTKQSHNLKMRQ